MESWIRPEEVRIFQHQEKPVLMTNQVAMSISRPAAASRNFHTLLLTPRRISGRRKNFLILYSFGLLAHCQACLNPQVLSHSTHILGSLFSHSLGFELFYFTASKAISLSAFIYDALKKRKNISMRKGFVCLQPLFSAIALKAL